MNNLQKTLLQILTGITTVCLLVNIVYTARYKANKGSVNSEIVSSIAQATDVRPIDPNAVILKGLLDHSIVEITKCIGNGSELVMSATITNQGVDGELKICGNYLSDSSTRIYDDSGNRITCNLIEVGNVRDRSSVNFKFISGVKVPIRMTFTVPTIGGQTQARKIALLELYGQTNKAIKCEFRNIKVETTK